MHRLFTVSAILVSSLLISMSADASPGGPHVKVFSGNDTAATTDDGHKDWINLNRVTMIRWAPGVESPDVKVRGLLPASPRGSGLPTGKRQHKPFVVTKPVDKASPLLARAAKSGQPLRGVVLVLSGEDGRSQTIPLEPVYITSYQTHGSAAKEEDKEVRPTETMSLNF
jgi:type VI secretion system Hcp family effector